MSDAAPVPNRKKPPYLLLFCIGFPIGMLLAALIVRWVPVLVLDAMGL